MPRGDGEVCARCEQPAEGYAAINGVRFCHGDYEPGEPTCFMLASWSNAGDGPLARAFIPASYPGWRPWDA